MRKLPARTGLNLSQIVSAQEQVQQQDPGLAVRLHAMRDGVRAAAWLVFKHKRRFHTEGFVDFPIEDDAKTPPWFRVAVAYFQLGPHRDRWSVVVYKTGGANDETTRRRVYRVEWRDWGYYRGWREDGCPPKPVAAKSRKRRR